MTGELKNIIDDLGLLLERRGAANTPAEENQLAGGLAVERAEEQLLLLGIGVGG